MNIQPLIRTRALVLLLPILAAGILPAKIPENLELKRNEQATVSFPEDVRSATASDPSVVTLKGIGQRQLVIQGVGNGTATVDYELRNNSGGKIVVQVGDGPVLPAIKNWVDRRLRGVVGVETRIDPTLQVVEITGTVMIGESFDKVKQLAERAERQWPRQVINSVEFNPDYEFAEEVIETYLAQNHIVNPEANLDNRRLRVTGTAPSKDDADRVAKNLPKVVEQLRLGEVLIENQIVVDESMVELEMTFFQMSESVVEEIGMDLLNNIGFDVKGAAVWGEGKPQYTAVLNVELSKVFNMLQEQGDVDTLHHTTVTTANGEVGKSQMGETIVIVKRGEDNDAVEEIDVGHILHVTPRLRSGKKVSLEIEGEVSEFSSIDPDSNVRINKNSFENTMNIPVGSGVVAAFHKAERKIEVNTGTPILRHIPLIKGAFSKRRYEDSTFYRGFIITARVQNQEVDLGESVVEETQEIINKIQARNREK